MQPYQWQQIPSGSGRRLHPSDGSTDNFRHERTSEIFVPAPAWASSSKEFTPDAARPAHLRDDARHSADPTHALRLRHQFRPATSARRRAARPISGPQGRTLLHAMKNSTYFDFVRQVQTEAEGARFARARRRCSLSSTFRKISAAIFCAAIARPCWSRPMRPIRPRPASRSARSRTAA